MSDEARLRELAERDSKELRKQLQEALREIRTLKERILELEKQ